ncbi:MAG TPA: parallel beta-helix domain-containing protein [Sandaracinaceae bacterium LLY-WYZ-13_1]|nr:parallel beta-helix domain-containing protein [Sandaracinaceae bacterium LLY-WYZ-13_1]
MRLGWNCFTAALGLALGLATTACDSTPEGCDYYVEPGEDDQTAIQTAFIDAMDGETVCLAEGEYTLTDPIEISNRTDFTLRGEGMEATTLNFAGQTAGGTGIDMMNMTNVLIEDLGVIDAAGNGIRIQGSEGIVIRRVRAGWTTESSMENGKYAIYPVTSTNVLIEDSEAFNSADAGFYMGQTENCVMRNNLAYGNVAAYEVENSTNCEVYGNVAENNTGGILVFELPGLPATGGGTWVHDNEVRNNNVDNFAEEGAIVAFVPRGTGIFVLAANDVEISDNTVTGNEGTGLAVVSWGTVQVVDDSLGGEDPDYDPWSERVYVHDNTFENNGAMPGGDGSNEADPLWQIRALLAGAGVDIAMGLESILWDGLMEEGASESDVLCIQDNGAASFRDLDVVKLATSDPTADTNTDASPHDCTHDGWGEVDLSWAAFADE